MANITRKVTRQIPAPRQWWTSTDANDNNTTMATGDIFKLNDSLHGPASEVVITTAFWLVHMSFRTNSSYPKSFHLDHAEFQYGDSNQWLASGVFATDQSQTPIVIPTNSSMTLTGPINDLEICSISGTFTLRAKR